MPGCTASGRVTEARGARVYGDWSRHDPPPPPPSLAIPSHAVFTAVFVWHGSRSVWGTVSSPFDQFAKDVLDLMLSAHGRLDNGFCAAVGRTPR